MISTPLQSTPHIPPPPLNPLIINPPFIPLPPNPDPTRPDPSSITGAIGSNRKIDASYLSPHVNFTEFLESSTKEYGVPLLFSEQFYNLLSSRVKKLCRQVDRIRRYIFPNTLYQTHSSPSHSLIHPLTDLFTHPQLPLLTNQPTNTPTNVPIPNTPIN